jgi:hypothetical protein
MRSQQTGLDFPLCDGQRACRFTVASALQEDEAHRLAFLAWEPSSQIVWRFRAIEIVQVEHEPRPDDAT